MTILSCCSELNTLIPASFFKALGDPNRLAILSRLAQCREPCSVSAVADCCSVSFSVVARHLAKLRDAGVVVCKKHGKEVRYSINKNLVVASLRGLADAIEACCPPETCSGKE